MNRVFEVKFTVYLDEGWTKSSPDLNWLTSIITAASPQSAQAMVEAQYRGLAHIHSVSEYIHN